MNQLQRLVLRVREPNVEPDVQILEDCLMTAESAIKTRRYPYHDWPEELEPRYRDLQFRIALDLYNRIGAEGQTAHSENGISRTWDSSWISEELLSEVVPLCGVVK